MKIKYMDNEGQKKLSRRELLTIGAVAGAGLLISAPIISELLQPAESNKARNFVDVLKKMADGNSADWRYYNSHIDGLLQKLPDIKVEPPFENFQVSTILEAGRPSYDAQKDTSNFIVTNTSTETPATLQDIQQSTSEAIYLRAGYESKPYMVEQNSQELGNLLKAAGLDIDVENTTFTRIHEAGFTQHSDNTQELRERKVTDTYHFVHNNSPYNISRVLTDEPSGFGGKKPDPLCSLEKADSLPIQSVGLPIQAAEILKLAFEDFANSVQ